MGSVFISNFAKSLNTFFNAQPTNGHDAMMVHHPGHQTNVRMDPPISDNKVTINNHYSRKMQSSSSIPLVFCALTGVTLVVVSLLLNDSSCHALSSTSKQPPKQPPYNSNKANKPPNRRSKTSLSSSSSPKGKTKRNKFGTIADVMEAALHNPNAFSSISGSSRNNAANSIVSSSANGRRKVNANGRYIDVGSGNKGRRTRKKVDRPRQQYVYAGQRRTSSTSASITSTTTTGGATRRGKGVISSENSAGGYYDDYEYNDDDNDDDTFADRTIQQHSSSDSRLLSGNTHQISQQQQLQQTKERAARMEYLVSLGLSDPYTSQVADAIVGDGPEEVPRIVETIRLTVYDGLDDDDDNDDDGGGILAAAATTATASNSFAYIVYKPVGWSILGDKKSKRTKNNEEIVENVDGAGVTITDSSSSTQPQDRRMGRPTTRRVKAYDEQLDDFIFVEYNEEDVLAAMTPSERAELMMEGGLDLNDISADAVRDVLSGTEWDDDDNELVASAKKRTKLKREKDVCETTSQQSEGSIAQRRSTQKANLELISRPSLVNWLKEYKANEGTPIKGGKNWVALSGATEIDDSGLVLLCPRNRADTVTVEECSFVAVVGNGRKVSSRSRLLKSIRSCSTSIVGKETCDISLAKVDILSRIKKWREDDPIATVLLTFPAGISTCNHAVLVCQDRFGDGVRGDAMADPLDRRSPRRLVHCTSLLVSTMTSCVASKSDDEVVPTFLPDDIATYANRRDGSSFSSGDFLGRRNGLGMNALTTAYREMNGSSDGHPGWIVDRYGKWLFVQHHHVGEKGFDSLASPKGPLPSLHDGYTAGVYYLPTWADRSVMGSERIKPTLLEGQAAPEYIPIVENGIQYLVNLGNSFSTGIFLDQRLQRAYLAGVCNKNTRVLNCFAHTGAFSVAAASAGARTVSLDLENKWLNRIRPQFESNGIMEWEGQHDCLFGDCKCVSNLFV